MDPGSKDDRKTSTLSATEAMSGTTARNAIALVRGDALGRYLVVDRLGAGGMGVVYAAYDPDLDRKLAVKVLRPEAARDQARLLREGRAMARVQHPNVIAVHDVGTFQDQVFVAMELVDGVTLSQWLEEHQEADWRAIVGLFVQAGRGLAAAHAAGLVHRDFKAANVLVGRDGRVRVVDFGLAHSTSDAQAPAQPADASGGAALSPSSLALENITRTGALAGTPPYMSPEQFLGLPVDARSDQFSFSVALYRALFGDRPFAGDDLKTIAEEVVAGRLRPPPKSTRVPVWVQKIVLRGLSTRIEGRWPSMDAMLAALEHDPARVRRRWLAVAGTVIGLGALALGYPLWRGGALVCRGSERKLVGVWDDARKNAVHAAFAATGQPYADAAFVNVARALDAWSNAFVAAHTEACEATRVRHELSEDLLDLRMECLGQRLQETKAEVDLFAQTDPKVVQRSAQMVSALSSLSSCSDVAALRAPVRPPADAGTRAVVERLRAEIAHGKALGHAAKYDQEIALLQPVVAAARSTGYRPVEARALAEIGFAQLDRGKFDEAEATLQQAAVAARAGRDVMTEIFVWELLTRAADLKSHFDLAQERGRYGLAVFESSGTSDQRPLGRLLMIIASNEADAGHYEQALADDQRSLAIREATSGPNSVETAASLEAVARVLGNLSRYSEAEKTVRRALAIWERTVGPAHPLYASSLFNLAYVLNGQGRYDEALAQYRRTLDIWERALGRDNPRLAIVLTNIGDILTTLGRYDEALGYDRRALAIAEKTEGPYHADVGLALNNVADVLRLQHKSDEALDTYRRAIAVWQKSYPADHVYFANPLTGMGEVELDRGQPARALPWLEQALALRAKHPDSDALEAAETDFAAARAQWETGGNRAHARSLATSARAAYARAANQQPRLATVDAWLAKHPLVASAHE